MNLRVRSVTGCSRSAMFASCIVRLVRILDTLDIHAATYKECVGGSFDGRTKSSSSSLICVCAPQSCRLALG